MTTTAAIRKKRCKYCKEMFVPYNTFSIKACLNYACIVEHKNSSSGQKILSKAYKADVREFNLNDKAVQINLAQVNFNGYIRQRDQEKTCISCGKRTGCKVNAGHYRPVGSWPMLRFEEDNCHLQCEYCNQFKSGNLTPYRLELIQRIGLERVEWLEGPHEPIKYTLEDFIRIKENYAKNKRDLRISQRQELIELRGS